MTGERFEVPRSKTLLLLLTAHCSLLTIVGCRTATRVTEVPRVDLELEGGNRGYLVGHPPDAAAWKTTRQMVQMDVEVPSFYQPTRSGTPVNWDGIAPPETETEEPVAQLPAEGTPVAYDTYVVKKGDSLWSIAAKPEVYGKATRWRRIFDANRELLKSPDRLRPGMTLKIPRGASNSASANGPEGETTFKK